MDTGKAIKAMLLAEERDSLRQGSLHVRHDAAVPLIAIPTTAGTGSEATQTAVVYVEKQKVSISHPALLPDAVILDPMLLKGLPLLHRKCCALDALCQGIESFWAPSATLDSQRHAANAFLSVLEQFPAYLSGDEEAARFMLRAAYESGCAIQVTRTTAAHAMSYILTKTYNLPHGYACALTLPAIWKRLNADPSLVATMERLQLLLGLRNRSDGPLLIEGLLIDLQLPALPAWEDTIGQMLTGHVNAERLGNHPQKLTQEDLTAIYREAFQGLDPGEARDALELWRVYAGIY